MSTHTCQVEHRSAQLEHSLSSLHEEMTKAAAISKETKSGIKLHKLRMMYVNAFS